MKPVAGRDRANREHAGHEHVVGFYEDDDFLVGTVVDFLAPALDAGDSPIVIATPEHRDLFAQALVKDGRGGSAGTGPQQAVVMVDAAETLERFLVDDAPDATRFRAALEAIIGRATKAGRPVRLYGEMVALLWEQGNVAAAVTLEDLWNDLATSTSFALLCAYPMRAFEQPTTTSTFRDVCERHGRVIPSESYSLVSDPDERLRAVALLQGAAVAADQDNLALEREHAELEEALARLHEMERARKEFVAMVVHDIRGPAAVIAASLELLQDGWADLDEASIRQLLDGATANAMRVERLAADMLTLSRIDAGGFSYEIRPVALDRLVAQVAADVAAAEGRVIRVGAPPDGLPAALADGQRQLQILGNLLSNAVKFSPDDSVIAVTMRRLDDEVVVSIRDQGVGIDPTDQWALFQPFTRVRSQVARIEGWGLGLYTAKVLVEGQGGRIWVDSAPGEGSTFSYTVPIASD